MTAPASRGGRLRKGLRRHGLAPRPQPVRALVREPDLHFTEGNRVDLFHEGRDGLEAMLAAIAAARERIHLETYILRADETGLRFLSALEERSRRGVAVRLLYDAFGSFGVDEGALEALRETGAQVVAFNPIGRLYPRWAPRRRDHRKILVVDGRVAFAGGLNLGDEYWGAGSESRGWRDTHLRIEGPGVRQLDAVFLESWFRADAPELDWHDLLSAAETGPGDIRCAVLPDGPAYRRRRMRELLISGLAAASEEVVLASPYFAPGRRVLRQIAETAGRGVSVDLVLAGTTDHPSLRRAAHSLLPRLLERGVRVHEFQPSVMHAKVAVFDRRWAIVGSSNLDRQSFEHSYEVNLVLEGEAVVSQLRDRFALDVSESTTVDMAALARRSWLERCLDRAASWLLRLI